MAKDKKKKKEKGGKLGFIMLLLVLLALITFLKATIALLLLGMLPAIVAYYADTTEDKMAVSTVMCCNLSGCLPYIVDLAHSGGHWSNLSIYTSDPMVWATMYGLAALGYVLIKVCPLACSYVLVIINSSIVLQLQQKQDSLIKKWGEGIKKSADRE